MSRLIYTLLLIMLSHTSASAIQYRFSHLSTKDGLSHNSVLCIRQDAHGFMWIATRDGLNRYDGHLCKQYEPINSNVGFANFYTTLEACDSMMWIGSHMGLFCYDELNDAILPFSLPQGPDTQELPTGYICDIDIVEQNVYILTTSALWCYNMKTRQLEKFNFEEISEPEHCPELPVTMCADSQGNIWLGGRKSRLSLFCPNQKKIVASVSLTENNVEDLILSVECHGNILYAGMNQRGVISYDMLRHAVNIVNLGNNQPGKVHDLMICNNKVWAGTESGLYIYDIISKESQNIRKDVFDKNSISDNAIYAVYNDNNGGIWLGSYFAGVSYMSFEVTGMISSYYPLAHSNSISGNAVREIIGDNDGNIWIGTEDAGLNKFDPEKQTFQHISTKQGLCGTNIHGLANIADDIYIGVYGEGMDIINTKTGKISHCSSLRDRYGAINSVYSICMDRRGGMIIGTNQGIYRYGRHDDTYHVIPGMEMLFGYQVITDTKGNLWVAAAHHGLIKMDVEGNVTNISNMLFPNNYLSRRATAVFEDSRGGIWCSTLGSGIFRYKEGEEPLVLNMDNGLPNNIVYRPLEDNAGNIWFGTNKGLVRYNPTTQRISIFTLRQALPSLQFNYNSAYKDNRGHLYFGTVQGLVVVNPDMVPENIPAPKILVSDCWINNEYQHPLSRDDNKYLSKSIIHTQSLELPYHTNSVSFQLSMMEYNDLGTHACDIKLEKHDATWVPISNDRRVHYTNLPTGTYRLLARVTTKAGEEEEIELMTITIRPPWWRSTLAYIILTIILVCLAILIYKRTTKRIRMRHLQLWKQMKRHKEQEIHHAKMAFFTNVTHEIKTPLSLIKVPLDDILQHGQCDEATLESLKIMDKNVDRLIALTNQLLDIRKLETKSFPLHYEYTNINIFLDSIYMRFHDSAELQNIDFSLYLPHEVINATIDVELLTKIISNLFNNALKYCDHFIKVNLRRDEECFVVEIFNDGDIIPEDMTEKIFEPFIHLETSKKGISRSGLGLPLARSLAELLGGTLICQPEGMLNYFRLTIPLHLTEQINNLRANRYNDEINGEGLQDDNTTSAGTVLIVEDNDDMRKFLCSRLAHCYNTIGAHNGKQALEVLQDNNVDLVISDIMMPEMGGVELLTVIRDNVSFSHIPVIMLTALDNNESRILSLDRGADAYIEKPFSIEYLLTQISNLLEKRQSVKNAFIHETNLQIDALELSEVDRNLMNKIDNIIDENIGNHKFNIDTLAAEINMSRSSFHRKVKGMLNLTPNDYLRLYRLKRAAQMMQSRNYIIKEVAQKTGFTSMSYFSKVFQSQFGISPREYVRNLKKQ